MTRYPRLLNSALQEVKRLTPFDGSLTLNLIPLSTASLTISTEERVSRGDWIEMFKESGSAGIFRVRSVQDEYGDDMTTVELDHSVAEVGDYLVDDEINEESTFSAALRKIFNYYGGSKWHLDEGNYTDSVIIDVDNENVLQAMLSIMEQQPLYYMDFDFHPGGWGIRILPRGTVVEAEGRITRNLQSASVTYDDSELCTRVYVEYGDSSDTTLTSYDAETIPVYGLHEGFLSGSYSTESEAQTAAVTYLGMHRHPSIAVSISAIDLSETTGEPFDSFEIGRLYRLALPKYGIAIEENITALSWSSLYLNPKEIEVSLADVNDPVVSFLKSTKKSSSGTSKKVKKTAEQFKKTVIDTESKFSRKLEDTKNDLHSEIVQTASVIMTSVWSGNSSLYSIVKQTSTNIMSHVGNTAASLHSEIEQTASEIRASVWSGDSSLYSIVKQTSTNIMSHVGNVSSTLHSEIEQTASEIRSSVWSGNSSLYSIVKQTSTNIMQSLGNATSSLHSEIEQTASSITNSVWNGNSSLYSIVKQTATNIMQSLGSATSSLHSEIEQTASQITNSIWNGNSSLYSVVKQTSTSIMQTVGNTAASLSSSIQQTASQISMKVGKGEVISSINQTPESITINANKVNLNGYVTTSMLESAFSDITQISVSQLTVSSYCTFLGYNATWQEYNARRVTLSDSHAFRYESSSGASYGTVNGRIVTGYSDTTLYYVGR